MNRPDTSKCWTLAGHILTIDQGELRKFGPTGQELVKEEVKGGTNRASGAANSRRVAFSVTQLDYVRRTNKARNYRSDGRSSDKLINDGRNIPW